MIASKSLLIPNTHFHNSNRRWQTIGSKPRLFFCSCLLSSFVVWTWTMIGNLESVSWAAIFRDEVTVLFLCLACRSCSILEWSISDDWQNRFYDLFASFMSTCWLSFLGRSCFVSVFLKDLVSVFLTDNIIEGLLEKTRGKSKTKEFIILTLRKFRWSEFTYANRLHLETWKWVMCALQPWPIYEANDVRAWFLREKSLFYISVRQLFRSLIRVSSW